MRSFIVPGEPQGKGRHRTTKSGHTYTPAKTAAYEDTVRHAYWYYHSGSPPHKKGVPLKVTINAFFAAPKSVKTPRWRKMMIGILRPTKKPDADNISKIILDALNPVKDKKTGEIIFAGAYHDDAQIVDLHVKKFWYSEPRVEVTISEIEQEEDHGA